MQILSWNWYVPSFFMLSSCVGFLPAVAFNCLDILAQ